MFTWIRILENEIEFRQRFEIALLATSVKSELKKSIFREEKLKSKILPVERHAEIQVREIEKTFCDPDNGTYE